MYQLILILILILLALSPLRSKSGWFDSKEQEQRIQQQEQELALERNATGVWQIIAGVTAVGAVILFTLGTALGSTTRRNGKAQ